MRDMHVHTEFSCDSEAKIVDYISEAKNKGITTICFTDHVDLNNNDYGYNYYSADGFWKKISEIKSNENQGIAKHTLDLLVNDAKAKGVSQIALEATDMGRPLYEKYGFVKREDEMELK